MLGNNVTQDHTSILRLSLHRRAPELTASLSLPHISCRCHQPCASILAPLAVMASSEASPELVAHSHLYYSKTEASSSSPTPDPELPEAHHCVSTPDLKLADVALSILDSKLPSPSPTPDSEAPPLHI
ncbi:hypothetical protein PIB30_077710 [Stylosanthes scabra]|uniref:Uncharacterized protein n=1 Tax=Stylosanthes scabra TaxID=79078 RepID=A0ABU6RQG8_9FABA|nr:hypothetical protein [Stylosanthes scabra]